MNRIFPDQATAMQWPILALINLVAALFCFSFLAYAMAERRWRGRGAGLLMLGLLLCSCLWLIPEGIRMTGIPATTISLGPLWLADWLGAIVSVSLFGYALNKTSPAVVESARLDGCGPLRIYWHIVLPLVRPTLLLAGVLVALLSCAALLLPLPAAGPLDLGTLLTGIALPLVSLGAILLFLRKLV
jgi:multiple sugar transport system permease protein